MINKQNTIGDNTRSEDTASMHSDRDDSSEGDARSEVEVESPLIECDISKLQDSHIVLQQLSRDDKYRILTIEPNSDPLSYPRTRPYQTSSFRQFQPSWMKQTPVCITACLQTVLSAVRVPCLLRAMLVARI